MARQTRTVRHALHFLLLASVPGAAANHWVLPGSQLSCDCGQVVAAVRGGAENRNGPWKRIKRLWKTKVKQPAARFAGGRSNAHTHAAGDNPVRAPLHDLAEEIQQSQGQTNEDELEREPQEAEDPGNQGDLEAEASSADQDIIGQDVSEADTVKHGGLGVPASEENDWEARTPELGGQQEPGLGGQQEPDNGPHREEEAPVQEEPRRQDSSEDDAAPDDGASGGEAGKAEKPRSDLEEYLEDPKLEDGTGPVLEVRGGCSGPSAACSSSFIGKALCASAWVRGGSSVGGGPGLADVVEAELHPAEEIGEQLREAIDEDIALEDGSTDSESLSSENGGQQVEEDEGAEAGEWAAGFGDVSSDSEESSSSSGSAGGTTDEDVEL